MYTDRISLDLARELESKGFIPDIVADGYWDIVKAEWKTEEACYDTYADVFDWFMEKGIYISICHMRTSVGLEWYPMVNHSCPPAIDGREWNHSANIAIRKALELI